MQADITSLQWGESELAGRVSYQPHSPPSLEIELQGGELSLLPWENAYLNAGAKDPAASLRNEVGLDRQGKRQPDVGYPPQPAEVFDPERRGHPEHQGIQHRPAAPGFPEEIQLNISGRLDSLLSTAITAEDIHFTGSLTNGQLALQASSGRISDGSGEITLALDSRRRATDLPADQHL